MIANFKEKENLKKDTSFIITQKFLIQTSDYFRLHSGLPAFYRW